MATAMTTRKMEPQDMEALGRALGVEPAQGREIFPSLEVCVCPHETFIVKEGEQGTEAYLVLKGELSVRRRRWGVFQKEVARLKPGDIFGEINFLLPVARSASVAACGTCEVLRLPSKDLKRHLDARPELRARIEELARRRLFAQSDPG